MFCFCEKFKLYDENYKPYGVRIQSSSTLWHKHALCGADGYSVACTGNKYFFETPELKSFEATVSFKFGALHNYAAVSFFFGYSFENFSGHELRIEWQKDRRELLYKTLRISEERLPVEVQSSTKNNVEFAESGKEYVLKAVYRENKLVCEINGYDAAEFDIDAEAGLVGVSRPHFIGSVTFTYAEVSSNLPDEKPIASPVKVEIPLTNGGTMPLTMEYKLFEVNGKPYLTATLDGGPQYRTSENYDPFPCNKRGQYVVERWFMRNPYIKYNGKKYLLKMGELNLSDPGLAWKEILYPSMNFSFLPLSVTVPLESSAVEKYSFGYDELCVICCGMQKGGAEFNFAPNGEYLGETVFEDSFSLRSPADKKAVRMIPNTVFDYPTVKKHFEDNHYFAEDEDIRFEILANTKKDYITYKAELRDVFGDAIEEISIVDGVIHHTPMPVGVYRIFLSVYYGDEILKTVDTVFEVFDETGKRCAPIESGLPLQFSMTNEVQYNERDPFDPWRTQANCNTEHYYSCTAYTGHVAEYKRTWEVTKLFGREWYVWLGNHRSMVDHNIEQHMDIVKNADYLYYPSDYEWGVLRSDFYTPYCWDIMKNESKTYDLLNEFLDSMDGARERVGLERGGSVTSSVIAKLYKYYKKEWYALAHERIKEAFVAQNEMFKKINPNFKRACYGPFNVYVSTMRTIKLSEAYGFKDGDTISDDIYTGFAQFEDYPMSCAYQTYRGAFGVGASLVKAPNLRIYPEQYKSSKGGCIDGAVYFAYPPIGKIEHPAWFNNTHAREYVYNTARKTEDGYAYWNTYGFMKNDFPRESDESFVKEWKYILRHKPKSHMKSPVFVCEFDDSDDGFDGDFQGWLTPYNVSEEGVGYLYESTRMAGIPSGVFTDWKALMTITAEDTDLLVLPSTLSAPAEAIAKIRELYSNGVSLIAVSRVDGLEDIFGVRYAPQKVKFNLIETESERDNVYPYEEEARYESDGAECIITASGVPAIFKQGRTAILNISPNAIGRSYFYEKPENARSSNNELLRKTINNLILNLSSPIAISDGAGITMLKDTSDNTILLAIDYSNHDQKKLEFQRESVIRFNEGEYTDAESLTGIPMRKLISKSGRLDGVVITLKQHESAIIKLI